MIEMMMIMILLKTKRRNQRNNINMLKRIENLHIIKVKVH